MISIEAPFAMHHDTVYRLALSYTKSRGRRAGLSLGAGGLGYAGSPLAHAGDHMKSKGCSRDRLHPFFTVFTV